MTAVLAVLRRILGTLARGAGDRRGSVAIVFAAAVVPLLIAVGAGVDFARLSAGRSALQRAVDNAALSGAAAYEVYTENDAFRSLATTVATSAFCNAVTTLPAGFSLGSGQTCGGSGTPAVSGTIGGFRPGTRGSVSGSGCSSTNTVVAGVTCGFIVTVTATGTMGTIFPFLPGPTIPVTVTASAANPFLDLANALKPTLTGSAWNANSIWVYPLLLDANGNPDFTTNAGALPDSSACTGAPTQTSCGVYTMLASTKYSRCTSNNPCNVNGTIFGGTGGIVQHPVAGNAVITATTPLGIAFASAAGGDFNGYGYNTSQRPPGPPQQCYWPATAVYTTLVQEYDSKGNPLVVDSRGYWTLPTHWFYSSYLANNLPPSQGEINLQTDTQTNPSTGIPYQYQIVPPVEPNTTTGATCPGLSDGRNYEAGPTTYPTSGNTNCSLYVVRDPGSLNPPLSGSCFSPAGTPGQQYAALSCQGFAGHQFAFFWNDMGGTAAGGDNKNYGDGTLVVACNGTSRVILIN